MLLEFGVQKLIASQLAEFSDLYLEDLGWVSLLQKQKREYLNHSIGDGNHPKDPTLVHILSKITSGWDIISFLLVQRFGLTYQ